MTIPVSPVDPATADLANQSPSTDVDDATLSEFEQGVVRQFAERGREVGQSDEGDGGEVDPAGDAISSSTPDPSTDQTPPGSQEGTDSSAEGAAPDAPPDPSQTPPAGEAPPAPDATADGDATAPDAYLGRPRSDIEAALQTYDWAKALPAEALQGIDAYLTGAYVLVPREQVEGGATSPPPGASPSTGSPSPSSTTTDDGDDYMDPAVARRLQAMQQEMEALRATTQSQVQRRQQEEYETLLSAVDRGSQEFSQQRGLTEDEIQRVQAEATRLGTLQTGRALHPSDPVKAVLHALDLAYLSDASFQQREIDRRVQQQLADQDALAARKARASAVTSAPGSVAKPSPTPPSKMTASQRDKAMSEEIAAAMANR